MFVISPTDYNWLQQLKASGSNSYVNFWTPTPWNIKKLKPGSKWYFLLKSPIRKIGGFGEFVDYSNLTADEAWREYGQRNGCVNKLQLIERIQTYIDKNSKEFGGQQINASNYKIGCITLNNCEFWEEEHYKDPISYQVDFPKEIVKFKYFEQYDPFTNSYDTSHNFQLLNEPRENYKKETNQRKGQGAFKGKVLKAYNNKCCISGENCPELLDAAHLQPYLNESSNHIQNGLLIRVDLHRLLDKGLLCIDQNYVVHISTLLRNTLYMNYDGIKISLPANQREHPSKEALRLIQFNFRI